MSVVPDSPTSLERDIYASISQICARKSAHAIKPDYALWRGDILPIYSRHVALDELKSAVRSLCKQGVLRFGNTINDVYFEITKR